MEFFHKPGGSMHFKFLILKLIIIQNGFLPWSVINRENIEKYATSVVYLPTTN